MSFSKSSKAAVSLNALYAPQSNRWMKKALKACPGTRMDIMQFAKVINHPLCYAAFDLLHPDPKQFGNRDDAEVILKIKTPFVATRSLPSSLRVIAV